jgi:hypothetical protein
LINISISAGTMANSGLSPLGSVVSLPFPRISSIRFQLGFAFGQSLRSWRVSPWLPIEIRLSTQTALSSAR